MYYYSHLFLNGRTFHLAKCNIYFFIRLLILKYYKKIVLKYAFKDAGIGIVYKKKIVKKAEIL